VLGCFLAAPEISLLGVDETGAQVPAFASPEPAAHALARAAAYAEWRRRRPGAVPELDGFDPDRAHAIVGALLTEAAGGWLPAERVDDLLDAAGIPLVRAVSVASIEQAGQAAAAVGLPVALKAVGRTSSTRATSAACSSTSAARPTSRTRTATWHRASANG
jgi:acetyltransferase